jgi:acid phosphatase (class A)
MRLMFAALLLALAGCATAPTTAPPASAPAESASTPSVPTASAPGRSYIASAHLDARAFLAPPPVPDGPAQAADLAAVRAAQALKGAPRWTQAQADDDLSPFRAFGPVLGPAFTKENAPRTAALFVVLFGDAATLTAPAKDAFGRPRPPLVDPALATCMPLEPTKSYPSGHGTRGWMMALVLSQMVPEKTNALLARGREYGESRVVCAEHFPSDVEAGRLVGAAVFAAARADPAFARDLAAARAELRKALGL